MRHFVLVALSLVLLTGCAHLEVPSQEAYPFRAEFTAHGTVKGAGLNMQGAILLTSAESGVIQTYGPGGVATGSIGITADSLVVRDLWGRETDAMDLPLRGVIGLVAGDLPRGAYLYKISTGCGLKVVYHWGSISTTDDLLPRGLHVSGDKELDVDFIPKGRDIDLVVRYGSDTVWISLLVSQGGRWFSP